VNESEKRDTWPALIVIGGFAGTGKTAVSRRLSAELRIPRLGSDTLGHIIRDSAGIKSGEVDSYWIAYEVLFHLCEEFIASGVSAVLDLTMGWEFQWQHLDSIVRRHPHTSPCSISRSHAPSFSPDG
jgi:predicted kinase